MSAIVGWLEETMHGSAGFGMTLLVNLLVGLRHASDPDRPAAVATPIAPSEKERARIREAGFMGPSWSLGHSTTLAVLSLPLVRYGSHMPEPFQRTTEVAVGTVIVFLAVRLLYRW